MAASGAGVGTASDCEGEEQDDPSSSSLLADEVAQELDNLNIQDNNEKQNDVDELSAFRQQWQRELESTPTPPRAQPRHDPQDLETLTEEDKAKQLFLTGVELERTGKLYEAIQHYKRAIQIQPDIEIKLYESSELRDTPEEEAEAEDISQHENSPPSDDEDALEGEDLITRCQRHLARRGVICQSETPTQAGHISWLPYEVLVLLLRWVVSSDLDAISLERVGAACRGLYVAARDPDIWRSLCVKTWGIECGTPRANGFISWRDMYVRRTRLRLHGCYISKTSYLRHGENSFQDQFYRPWYVIYYYRYLRFFPDGVVLMWTTADDPPACVGALGSRSRTPHGILAGHYRLVKDKVVIVIKKTNNEKKQTGSNTRFRSRRNNQPAEPQEQVFHLELEVRDVRRRRNWQLAWSCYRVSPRAHQWTQFDITPSKFPPFAFSRVRSYTAEAHAPLLSTHAYT